MDWRAEIRTRLGPRRIATLKRLIAPVMRRDLDRLGRFYGTNKSNPNQRYTPLYERYLRHRRAEALCILEIGIGGYETGTGGSSLRVWRTYFPKARVYGIDIYPRDLREPRIETFCGSQSDRAFLLDVVQRIGAPDVVIDDGSHRSSDIIASFQTLFPLLAAGGLYVIEDTQYSFQPDYGGGPPGTDGTSVEFLKGMIDEIARRSIDGAPPDDTMPATLHFYPRIVFIEKRANPAPPG
jgi:hypothetical protein